MEIILTASITSCIGKSSKIVEDIKNITDVEFISKKKIIKENIKQFKLDLKNTENIDSLTKTLNYMIAKYKLKNTVITVKS